MSKSEAAVSPHEYIDALDEPRKGQIERLDALIRAACPTLDPFVHSGMLAYGPTRYKYASGREGDWFRIGLASNKNYISIYVCAADESGYLAERFRDRLPKASIGKSCVRFKRVEDLDEASLRDLLREAAAAPFSM
jgi:hypothetical protein